MWGRQKSKTFRIFFASDFHGSDLCYKKFLNAKEFYKANYLIYGGDITGKAIVPILKSYGNVYISIEFGNEVKFNSEREVNEFMDRMEKKGFYPIVVEKEEYEKLTNDKERMNQIFHELMIKKIEKWKEWAEKKFSGTDFKIYWQAGNDDAPELDNIMDSEHTVNIGEKVIQTEEGLTVLGLSHANMTPWILPRDVNEKDLMKIIHSEIEKLGYAEKFDPEIMSKGNEDEIIREISNKIRKLEDSNNVILAYHPPPFDTNIDLAPRLTEKMTYAKVGGQQDFIHVGSKSVRAAIEKLQPVVGLHGHIHESRGMDKVGKTLVFNPGSEYQDGVLRGVIVDISEGKIKNYLLTSG